TREAIFAMHRGDFEKSMQMLREAETLLREVEKYKKESPNIYYGGSTLSAQAEYVEATTLFAILSHQRIPTIDELRVEPQAYLLGMGDLVGEIRRNILDNLRKDDVQRAWDLLQLMETVFFELSKLSFPETLAPGLRHKIDVARALIENTRKDILFSEKSSALTRMFQKALKEI
ncbi:MAG: hypothetical protein ACP5IE_10085, partial [Infirmifilum sp.]